MQIASKLDILPHQSYSFFSAIRGSAKSVGTILLFLLAGLSDVSAAGLQFSGNIKPVLEVNPEASTGLEQIYVASQTDNLKISYKSTTPVKWYHFSNLGGGFAEEILQVSHIGDDWEIDALEGDSGYIVTDSDGRQHCFWLVDYSGYPFVLNSVSVASNQECDASILELDGTGNPIYYFTVLGQQKVLSRDIEVSYSTLIWDESKKQFNQEPQSQFFQYLRPELRVSPPALCQSDFVVAGDGFLRRWGLEQEVSTGSTPPHAVEVYTSATPQTSSANDSELSNIIKMPDNNNLGGSAPVDISFTAWTSDAVIHNEWQMTRDSSFSSIDYRFNQQDLDYTFNEEGTFYIRFTGSNSDGSCSAIGPVYTVSIGGSELRIPNVFSPNGDNTNDEWKVAYRSLISFECWIVDRYGNQVAHLTSPDQGWDGKGGGKLAPPGVYYYVITAKGADGKDYKESGDINIIRSVTNSESGNTY